VAAPAKTNAARLLDEAGIGYRLVPYEVDPTDLSAPTVAAAVGLPAAQVVKTLLVAGDRHGPCFVLLGGDRRLDPKALATLRGEKKMAPVPVRQLPRLTGYVRGGVTVLGARRRYDVVVDRAVIAHDRISVSAGQRGLQLFVAPGDYLAHIDATVADISSAPG